MDLLPDGLVCVNILSVLEPKDLALASCVSRKLRTLSAAAVCLLGTHGKPRTKWRSCFAERWAVSTRPKARSIRPTQRWGHGGAHAGRGAHPRRSHACTLRCERFNGLGAWGWRCEAGHGTSPLARAGTGRQPAPRRARGQARLLRCVHTPLLNRCRSSCLSTRRACAGSRSMGAKWLP
jgi:hypothetical protein